MKTLLLLQKVQIIDTIKLLATNNNTIITTIIPPPPLMNISNTLHNKIKLDIDDTYITIITTTVIKTSGTLRKYLLIQPQHPLHQEEVFIGTITMMVKLMLLHATIMKILMIPKPVPITLRTKITGHVTQFQL